MKQYKKLIVWLIVLLPFLQFAFAGSLNTIMITEIMYSSAQASDSDAEWLEIYNNGTEAVDLSLFTIDENEFDDITIQPYEAIVVARELLDSSDSDIDSFESLYGNSNGIWDENDADYRAVDGSFILNNDEDTIMLSDSISSYAVSYSDLFGADGNGLCLALYEETWQEQECSPGSYELQTEESSSTETDELNINLDVQNIPASITSIKINSETIAEGAEIDLLPEFEGAGDSGVPVELDLLDENGFDDIISVIITISNEEQNLQSLLILSSGSGDYARYTGSLPLEGLYAGAYNLTISVQDSEEISSIELELNYLPFIYTTISNNALDFDLEPGQSEEGEILIQNKGNVAINEYVEGSDLSMSSSSIPASNLLVYFGDSWVSLSSKFSLGVLSPSQTFEFALRIMVPELTKSGIYTGKIIFTAEEA
ncbi:lamin tail domain-containing protein [archaeon]|nr:lamin tail domain-containing protein [archaeon]